MKRFLIAAIVGLALIVGGIYLFFYRGFYLDLWPDAPVDIPFQIQGKDILIRRTDATYSAIQFRGVDVAASMPGEYNADFAPDEEDYLRWFTAIGEMGANLVRVHTVMDDDFYNAFYTYNTSCEQPLYLLQGLQVPDAVNNGRKDAYDCEFMGHLVQEGKKAVDVIHGRKMDVASASQGAERYLRDVSPWAVGYLVGHEWNADTIAYTDNSVIRSGIYQGEFFTTAEDASCFEAMLAQVMDEVMSYEDGKYKSQRLFGFISSPEIDFLIYEETYARQLGKYASLDAEHILPTKQVQSGYFAAYRLYDFCENFMQYLSEQQRTELMPLLAQADQERVYGGYLDLVGSYHTMPVIAAGYGFSSGRGAVAMNEPPLTEVEQGQAIVEVWEAAVAADWAGVCISTWQDAWERRTWNTAFAIELSQNYLWHDLQTDGEHYGLMAFEPGEEPVCILDGDPAEWMGDVPVLESDNRSLFVRYDPEGLYLLVLGADVDTDIPLYLPIDMTQDLGSMSCAEPALEFDREADFLLCIDGKDNTRLLVQERYDPLRQNFNYSMGLEDPFISWPEKDSPNFVRIGMALQNDTLIDGALFLSPEQIRQMRALGVWETGRFRHGNGDPDDLNYNSLADFCFGENSVEICIPWLLLNVADPVDMWVHQDYYEHYGVKSAPVDTIYMGLGDGNARISLTPLAVHKWDWELTWYERLKKSYEVIQEYWTN